MIDHYKEILVIGADNFGLGLKNTLRDYLRSKGYEVVDMGVDEDTPADYPDIRARWPRLLPSIASSAAYWSVAPAREWHRCQQSARRPRRLRLDPYTAERARASNNAQIITFGSQIVGAEVAKKLMDIWLQSEFQGGQISPQGR